ncbi:MAG: gamma-glutamyltransferase [bacterium]|nr:gamma-glutamyltransferase [bacterium]
MAVSEDPLATAIGLEVLQRGGNAVDAAVTMGFVMAVTHPQAGNIGGGGFMLFYEAGTEKVSAVDYREKAPVRAHRDLFLDSGGNANRELSRFSHLAAGVPGTVAGLALALHEFGTISLEEAVRPAAKLAREGFIVSHALSRDIKASADLLYRWPSTRAVFFKRDDTFYEYGDRLVQRDLACTLDGIAENGPAGFYEGKVADAIADQMEKHGGIISRDDLAQYEAVIREPVRGTYRGFEIYSMPPPSSGGVHLIQLLNILEGYDVRKSGHQSAATIHLMAEAMKRAYADRSEYLGDPGFFPVPLRGLTSKKYADQLRQEIDLHHARPAQEIGPGIPLAKESDQTTHFVVVDRAGNAVSNTYTLNFSFGSGIMVDGAGFLLNNEMDDFSSKPGVPNAYGLIGGAANAIEPGKRMLSSMSPSIVAKDGAPFLVTGSPGGSRIITTTLQVILNVVDHGMTVEEAVAAPRIHHQWLPDELRVEEGISADVLQTLQEMGHNVVTGEKMGAASTIKIDGAGNVFSGAVDPRRGGLAAGY